METKSKNLVRDRLSENAIRFLMQAATELADQPRDALIHLSSGLELLMKARLAHEHWSLVVDKPGSKSLAEINGGDFKSVSFQDAFERLEKITGRRWDTGDKPLLTSIAEHRNKLLHFYHHTLEGADEKLRVEVAKDQCRAWAVFHHLIKGPWSEAFPDIEPSLVRLHDAFKKNRVYLSVRFEAAKDKLASILTSGKKIELCGLCEFDAVVLEEHGHQLVYTTCEVCEARDYYLRFSCPNCSSPLKLEPEISTTCEACCEEFDISQLCDAIGLEPEPLANCWQCGDWTEDTAHLANDGTEAFCFYCFETFDPKPEECNRCGKRWIGFPADEQIILACPECREI